MGGYPAESCHRLPFPLEVCPTCGQGIKPARGWTWIDGVKLFSPGCSKEWLHMHPQGPLTPPPYKNDHCPNCVICTPSKLIPQKEFKPDAEPPPHIGESGLIWVGEKFYPTPEAFADEATKMGISRRIPAVPNGFVLGETWVFFAHRKAVEDIDNPAVDKRHSGIFQAFKPTSIEYVVTGKETEEELERMKKRGIEPVKVEHKHTNIDMWEDAGPPEDEPAASDITDYDLQDLEEEKPMSEKETTSGVTGKVDISLREVLPPRIATILEKSGYTYLSEMVGLDDLRVIPGVGKKTAEAISKGLDELTKKYSVHYFKSGMFGAR